MDTTIGILGFIGLAIVALLFARFMTPLTMRVLKKWEQLDWEARLFKRMPLCIQRFGYKVGLFLFGEPTSNQNNIEKQKEKQ